MNADVDTSPRPIGPIAAALHESHVFFRDGRGSPGPAAGSAAHPKSSKAPLLELGTRGRGAGASPEND